MPNKGIAIGGPLAGKIIKYNDVIYYYPIEDEIKSQLTHYVLKSSIQNKHRYYWRDLLKLDDFTERGVWVSQDLDQARYGIEVFDELIRVYVENYNADNK